MSIFVPSVGILAGITTSTPYGLPSVFSSIHRSVVSSSSGSLNRTQPSTPMPPARLTAAAAFSEGVKAKIGYWMPNRSHSSVCINWWPRMLGVHVVGGPLLGLFLGPFVVGFAGR